MDASHLTTRMTQMELAQSSRGRDIPSHGPPMFHPGMPPEELKRRMDDYKAWMEEDNQIPPSPSLPMDREELLGMQAETRESQREWLRNGKVAMRMTVVGFPKHSSSTELRKLERISLADMLVRKTHLGRYLLCRSIALSVRASAVQLAVEDPDGTAYGLSIYNFPTMFDCPPNCADVLFPIGVIFAIREPTFKPAAQGRYPILRVDSPTDIVFMDPQDAILDGVSWRFDIRLPGSPELPTTVDGWKERGNVLFKDSQWLPAAIAYTHGLQLDPAAPVLYSNRSEAYLRLRFYSGALADARSVARVPGVSDALLEKALVREAKAEYARENFEVALAKFEEWQFAHSGDNAAAAEIATWITRTRRRHEESRTGTYDWAKFFVSSFKQPHLDIADYQGSIEVRAMANRGGGRGIVATKDIAVGEVLLVSKPFVAIYDSDLSEKEVTMNVDFLAGVSSEPTRSAVIARAVEKIYGNPDLHDQVFDLYSGVDYPAAPPSYPPAKPTEPTVVNPLEPNVNIDISCLEAICTFNCFNPFPIRPFDTPAPDEDSPTGLYLLPSLFNHSCLSNATWCCVGDALVVRAAANVTAGTEITIPYTKEGSYLERTRVLAQHMVLHCDCWLCEADRRDGEDALEARHELMEEIMRDRKTYSHAELRVQERKVNATYARTRGVVRPSLAFVQHAKAEALRRTRSAADSRKAIEEDIKSLESMGYVVLPRARKGGALTADGKPVMPIATDQVPSTTTFERPVMTMVRMAEQFLILKDDVSATKWLNGAMWIIDMLFGGSKAFFMLMVGPMLRSLGMDDFAMRVL
ncbi:hypothetical protein BKA93DRAFT_776723 [Sparassis latifolia]|uniref:SET domain-containing protein n=1 Tax=Sparassis crispa TaxID=139825 RepID=A0A401GCJ9_9APHY|nr:predicted protein [Sparassis crispa]GBE79899.1 predicted protein [Sparassis crispa]